jgi:hypothetical protein
LKEKIASEIDRTASNVLEFDECLIVADVATTALADFVNDKRGFRAGETLQEFLKTKRVRDVQHAVPAIRSGFCSQRAVAI